MIEPSPLCYLSPILDPQYCPSLAGRSHTKPLPPFWELEGTEAQAGTAITDPGPCRAPSTCRGPWCVRGGAELPGCLLQPDLAHRPFLQRLVWPCRFIAQLMTVIRLTGAAWLPSAILPAKEGF